MCAHFIVATKDCKSLYKLECTSTGIIHVYTCERNSCMVSLLQSLPWIVMRLTRKIGIIKRKGRREGLRKNKSKHGHVKYMLKLSDNSLHLYGFQFNQQVTLCNHRNSSTYSLSCLLSRLLCTDVIVAVSRWWAAAVEFSLSDITPHTTHHTPSHPFFSPDCTRSRIVIQFL